MWIIPKQLHTSASALDTKALGLDSEEFSQICERSLTWRGKDSLSRTWLQRWKRENWMQHLCTRTLRPSLTGSFVDAWTSSLADSRVSHSVLPESVTALKTLDTCSLTSQTESESANLELFSSKTLKESSQPRQQTGNQFSNMSSESWKAWVIEQRREYSVRLKSAHLTRESGSSSLAWPTASARDWKDTAGMSKARDGKALGRVDQLPRAVYHHDGLLDQANLSTNGKSQESQQWPTPNTSDQYNPNIPHDLGRAYLRTEVLAQKTVADTKSQQSSSSNHRGESGATGEQEEGELGRGDSGSLRQGTGQAEPRLGGKSNGPSNRVDRLRLLGNGVVPATAAKAFVTLIQRLND